MKFSLWTDSANPPDETLERARWADATGWHGIWYADHYMPNTGTEEISDGPLHECWSMLPAIAVVTERLRLGPLVAPTSIHHPALLANRAVTIDRLSQGRMVLGLGAGWQINEHRAYGFDLQPPKERVDRFEEAIAVVRSLLTNAHTSFDGEYYTLVDAPCQPAPVQSPLPLLVGTGGERMMRITARWADEWNTWGTPEGATERLAAFRRACESVGADPATKWTSAQALVYLTDDSDVAATIRNGPNRGRSIIGNADQLLAQLDAYAAAGFDEFIIPEFNAGTTREQRTETLERIKAEVVDRYS